MVTLYNNFLQKKNNVKCNVYLLKLCFNKQKDKYTVYDLKRRMKKIKILIIEDDFVISMQIESLLESSGYEVVAIAKDYDEAISTCLNNKIDLLISDIKIKGDLDGIETSKKIVELQDVPIIFLTAYKNDEILKRISDLKDISFLVKPFREDELDTLVRLAIIKYNLPKQQNIESIDENYAFCFDTNQLYLNSQPVHLSKNELTFIRLLVQSKKSFLTYHQLEEAIWQGKPVSDDTRRQFIYRIKKKLINFPMKLKKGFGYKLDVD
jgi:DNA-binding response OmpR family regulator